MNNFQKIEAAKKAAPSYLHLKDDGADFSCDECGEYGRIGFVVPYTPDGKFHMSTHLECLDPSWVENAKDMGSI